VSELFDEVDEDVRRDQLKKVWDQYSIYIIAGAILIVAAVGGWRGYQYLEAKKAAEASAAFNQAVELSDANKHAEAEAAFNNLVANAPSGYRILSRLHAAAEVGAAEQDIARIRAAGLLVDTAGYPDMLARLEPASAPGATFRHTARELLALSAWHANDMTAARRWLDVIAIDNETPAGLRSRAEALQALLPPVAKS
jgi:hypothetical protein